MEETKISFGESDWGLVVLSTSNGFFVKTSRGEYFVIESKEEDDKAQAGVNLLWYIIDFFNLRPSRYAEKRPFAGIEAGDKYILKKGEKLVEEHYYYVEKE